MADEIDVLLARVEDEGLRQELATHVGRLRQRRRFGLVFEDHLPESVVLPQHQIRRGVKVVPREDQTAAPMVVTKVKGKKVTLTNGAEKSERPVDELVAVAEFGEPIYPGLKRLGSIERGGDKPAHVVIKGENYHALEALQFTHAGKVDCIYIDPPYNTGARDWKYNNDYVDGDDEYRHSKWLAFMQRRLLLAKKLLNPDDSVLIVTIDEKEIHRLALLIEQLFPDGDMETVSIVTNHAGSIRKGRMARMGEYLLYVFIGDAEAARWSSNLFREFDESAMPTVWFQAIRSGTGLSRRTGTPSMFYPIFLSKETGLLHSIGSPPPLETDRESIGTPPGTVAIWPVSSKGVEQTWQLSDATMAKAFAEGSARLGRTDPKTGKRPVTYMRAGTLKNIERGVFVVEGKTDEGAMIVGKGDGAKQLAPASVWNLPSHFARDSGTKLLKELVPDREFPFPKSLYAVEDAIRVAVGDKPSALVLDFFAGSGTTGHAVARLNRQDDGERRSIIVTNNEVSEKEARHLSEQGFWPGDSDWEALGIFEHITRPRIEAAIRGQRGDGTSFENDYSFTDEFPMADGFDENVEFVELEYLDSEAVELDEAFSAIAPLLWIRAGAVGPVLEVSANSSGGRERFVSSMRYGILFDTDHWRSFIEELPTTVTHVFVVTDSTSEFTSVVAELPPDVEAVRLYENYLSTFAINTGVSL